MPLRSTTPPLVLILLVACASGSGVFAPSPSASDVDAYGTARDPEIARCMTQQQTSANFSKTLTGPSVVPESKTQDYQYCWCQKKGHRGLGRDGECVD